MWGNFFLYLKNVTKTPMSTAQFAIECLSVVSDCRMAPCSCSKTPSLLQIFTLHSGRTLRWKLEVTNAGAKRPGYEATITLHKLSDRMTCTYGSHCRTLRRWTTEAV